MLRLTTQSGSVYEIDDQARTWRRVRGEGAALIRSDTGVFDRRSQIEIGFELMLYCPPVVENTVRVIRSTPITKIEHKEVQ